MDSILLWTYTVPTLMVYPTIVGSSRCYTIPVNTHTAQSNCYVQYASHYEVIFVAAVSVSPYTA